MKKENVPHIEEVLSEADAMTKTDSKEVVFESWFDLYKKVWGDASSDPDDYDCIIELNRHGNEVLFYALKQTSTGDKWYLLSGGYE